MIINCEFTLRRGKPIQPFSIRINPVSLRAEFNKWGRLKVRDEDSDEANEKQIDEYYGRSRKAQ